jgi:hypothetical protein
METITLNVFTFDELTGKARERALDWARQGFDYPWFDESVDSIKAFVEHFGARASDWSLGDGRGYIKTDITQDHMRGLKLKDFSPDHMPTGYCMDASLWGTFHAEWKKTGDPMYAFEQALEAAVHDVAADVEYQSSDEALSELLEINEYRFTEDGRIYK